MAEKIEPASQSLRIRVCPLLSISTPSSYAHCIETLCAWFNERVGCCAVVKLSEIVEASLRSYP